MVIERIKANKFTLIAEIGVNYYDVAAKLKISLMEAAKFMILSAHNAGIHAVKFQSYKAETLASQNSPAYWDTSEEATTSQYELFKKFDAFGANEYKEISFFCKQIGIEFCSTPFDFESADYLDGMMNFYKISSSDLNNLPFVEYIAKKNKPILLSVGAGDLKEIRQTVTIIRKYNKKELALLHCVLEYPTPYEHANLNKIVALKKEFPDLYIGYSDHTKPDSNCDVIKTAYLLGANVIEKHFTVDKTLRGNDHYHAMDVNDAINIIKHIAFAKVLQGSDEIKSLPSEVKARLNARRSIVARVNIPKGTIIVEDMLTFKRPGIGIAPNKLQFIVGKKTISDIVADSLLSWEMLE